METKTRVKLVSLFFLSREGIRDYRDYNLRRSLMWTSSWSCTEPGKWGTRSICTINFSKRGPLNSQREWEKKITFSQKDIGAPWDRGYVGQTLILTPITSEAKRRKGDRDGRAGGRGGGESFLAFLTLTCFHAGLPGGAGTLTGGGSSAPQTH